MTVNVVTAQRPENTGIDSDDYGGGATESDITMRGIRSNAAITGMRYEWHSPDALTRSACIPQSQRNFGFLVEESGFISFR